MLPHASRERARGRRGAGDARRGRGRVSARAAVAAREGALPGSARALVLRHQGAAGRHASRFSGPKQSSSRPRAFERVSPELAAVATRFFDERRVDAEPRRGKYGGAFCAGVSVRTAAYLFVNHADQLTDVLTLAHELGHGTHYTLSQVQSQNSWESGLALVEVPSTFAELLLVDHMTAAGVSDDVALRAERSRARRGDRCGVPADRVRPLRAARLRAAWRRRRAHARAPRRDHERGVREAPRGLGRRRARRSALDLGADPALHRYALLHVRLRVRVPRRLRRARTDARAAGLQRPLPAVSRLRRLRVPRRRSSPSSGSTSPIPASGPRRSRRSSGGFRRWRS